MKKLVVCMIMLLSCSMSFSADDSDDDLSKMSAAEARSLVIELRELDTRGTHSDSEYTGSLTQTYRAKSDKGSEAKEEQRCSTKVGRIAAHVAVYSLLLAGLGFSVATVTQSNHPKNSLTAYPANTTLPSESYCWVTNSTDCSSRYLRNPDECYQYVRDDGSYTLKDCHDFGQNKDPQFYSGMGSLVVSSSLLLSKIFWDAGIGQVWRMYWQSFDSCEK